MIVLRAVLSSTFRVLLIMFQFSYIQISALSISRIRVKPGSVAQWLAHRFSVQDQRPLTNTPKVVGSSPAAFVSFCCL